MDDLNNKNKTMLARELHNGFSTVRHHAIVIRPRHVQAEIFLCRVLLVVVVAVGCFNNSFIIYLLHFIHQRRFFFSMHIQS